MSERVICRYMRYDKNATNRRQIMPDPEAPSVAEIVEVLREAQEAMKWLRSGTDWSTSIRIDNLIARLEGA